MTLAFGIQQEFVSRSFLIFCRLGAEFSLLILIQFYKVLQHQCNKLAKDVGTHKKLSGSHNIDGLGIPFSCAIEGVVCEPAQSSRRKPEFEIQSLRL